MTGKITLISPPDVYVNKSFSIILINTTDEEESKITDWFSEHDLEKELSIYFYNGTNNLQWLVTAFAVAKHRYINLNSTFESKSDNSKFLVSHFLSSDNCYYTLDDENLFEIFRLLNTSKVDSIIDFLDRVIPIEHDKEPEL
jgi:hypothetical protein